jgi:cytidylate kinase
MSKCKFFLDADLKERTKRRTLEQMGKGANEKDIDPVKYEENLELMQKRDRVDMTREFGPLIRLKESIYIDTTKLTMDQVMEKMIEIVKEKISE